MRKACTLILLCLIALVAGCGGSDEEAAKPTLPGDQPSAKTGAEDAAKESSEDTDGDGVLDLYDSEPNEASGAGAEDPLAEEETSTSTAKVGDSIDIEAVETALGVTVTKIVDPLPVGGDDAPDKAGARFVGVMLNVKNIGDAAYDGASGNDVGIITRDGEQAGETNVFGGPCALESGNDFLEKMSPDEARQGCVVFEVEAGAKIGKVQFTADSGTGPVTGEWTP